MTAPSLSATVKMSLSPRPERPTTMTWSLGRVPWRLPGPAAIWSRFHWACGQAPKQGSSTSVSEGRALITGKVQDPEMRVEAIKLAKSKGFRVSINCTTLMCRSAKAA